jgi:transposase
VKRERDAEQRQRYRIVLCLTRSLPVNQIIEVLGAARSTIYRVAKRFRQERLRGLRDRRYEKEAQKVNEAYLERLEALIDEDPQAHGWNRSR